MPFAGLLLLLAAFPAVHRRPARLAAELWLGGGALGLAVATRPETAVFGLPLLALLVHRTLPRCFDGWPYPIGAALTWFAFGGLYNLAKTGSILDAGYQQQLLGDPLTGVAGLLISPSFGVLWFAPLLLSHWRGCPPWRGVTVR